MSTLRGVFLARLLGPDAFGLFFALAAVANMVSLGAEFGLGAYVVHAASEARVRVQAAASWAVVTGTIGGLVVVAASGVVSAPYGPDARPVALLLAASACVSPLSAVYLALLRVELRFKPLAVVQIVAEFVATAAALALALGAGRRDVWPLVTAALGIQVIVTIGGAAAAGFGAPRLSSLRAGPTRAIFAFGVPISIASITWSIALQGDNLIVGRTLGVTALGFYGLAYNYGALPSSLLGSVVGQVAFPVFSHARDAGAELGSEFIRFSKLIAVVVVPLIAAATVVADKAVEILLGEDWRPAVTPLRIFLVAGALRGLFPSAELLRAIGRVGTELRLGVFAAPAVLAAAAVGSNQDIVLVAILVATVFVVVALVGLLVAARAAKISFLRLCAVPLPIAALASTAAVGARFVVERVTTEAVVVTAVTTLATVLVVVAGGALGVIHGWDDLRTVMSRARSEPGKIDESAMLDPGPAQP